MERYKYPLLNSLNDGLAKEKFSVSLRQASITCLTKEGKILHYMKKMLSNHSYRVDYKIASACIADRLMPVLQNIISQTQKVF